MENILTSLDHLQSNEFLIACSKILQRPLEVWVNSGVQGDKLMMGHLKYSQWKVATIYSGKTERSVVWRVRPSYFEVVWRVRPFNFKVVWHVLSPDLPTDDGTTINLKYSQMAMIYNGKTERADTSCQTHLAFLFRHGPMHPGFVWPMFF